MKIGMPNLIETQSIENCMQLASSLGLDFVELNMNFPDYQLGSLDSKLLNELSKKYNLDFTIHLDENFNISDFNPLVADAYLQTAKRTIEFAKSIRATKINMHLSRGIYITLPDRKQFLYETYNKEYLHSIENFKSVCQQSIAKSNILICLENTDGFTSFHKQAIECLLESECFALTYDVGHDYCIGKKDLPFILQYEERLKHMHLHDATSQPKANHLALGDGEVNLKAMYNLAKDCDCSIVLETKTVEALKKSVPYLNNNLI